MINISVYHIPILKNKENGMKVRNIILDGKMTDTLDGGSVHYMPECLAKLHVSLGTRGTRLVNMIYDNEHNMVGEILVMDWGTTVPDALRDIITRNYISVSSCDLKLTCSYIVNDKKYEETIKSMVKWSVARYDSKEYDDDKLNHLNVVGRMGSMNLKRQKVTDHSDLGGPKLIHYTMRTTFPMLGYPDVYYYVNMFNNDEKVWIDLTDEFIKVDNDIERMKNKVDIKLTWGVIVNDDIKLNKTEEDDGKIYTC